MTVRDNRKLSQLDWVRAIAAFLVVGYHCEITMALPGYFGSGVFPFFKSGHAGVQLFFVLSGFVVYLAHHQDREKDAGVIKTFGFKRFRRIYPPLWLVLLPLTFLLLAGVGSDVPTVYDVVAAFLIIPAQKEVILATEWTLRHEILFYLLFALFLWDRRLGLLVLLCWAVLGAVFVAVSDQHWFLEFLFSTNHLLFLAGMGIAWVFTRGSMPAGVFALSAGLVIFVATYVLSLKVGLTPDVSILLFGAGASGIIYGLAGLPQLNRQIPFLNEAGASSYALYLIHYPVISILLKVYKRFLGQVGIPPYLYFFLVVFICYIVASAFHHWLEKPSIRMVSSRRERVRSA